MAIKYDGADRLPSAPHPLFTDKNIRATSSTKSLIGTAKTGVQITSTWQKKNWTDSVLKYFFLSFFTNSPNVCISKLHQLVKLISYYMIHSFIYLFAKTLSINQNNKKQRADWRLANSGCAVHDSADKFENICIHVQILKGNNNWIKQNHKSRTTSYSMALAHVRPIFFYLLSRWSKSRMFISFVPCER